MCLERKPKPSTFLVSSRSRDVDPSPETAAGCRYTAIDACVFAAIALPHILQGMKRPCLASAVGLLDAFPKSCGRAKQAC